MKNLLLVTLCLFLFGCSSSEEISYNESVKPKTSPDIVEYCKDLKPINVIMKKAKEKASAELKESIHMERQDLIDKTLTELVPLLSGNKTLSEKQNVVYSIGLKYARDEDYSTAFLVWECGAKKFHDPKSMLKLAQAYFHGNESANAQIPVPSDYNESYFWILSSIYIDILSGEPDNITANGLGIMDALQGMEEYVEKGLDRKLTKDRAKKYIETLFPGEEI